MYPFASVRINKKEAADVSGLQVYLVKLLRLRNECLTGVRVSAYLLKPAILNCPFSSNRTTYSVSVPVV